MPGLDPGIHPSSKGSREKRWMAGSSPAMTNYFASTGSGGTLSFGALACMVISVIDVMS
jgi:hypothetical protein